MNKYGWVAAFVAGLVAVVWIGAGFVGTSGIALAMTVAIGAVYLLGAWELQRFRAATAALAAALERVPQPLTRLDDWLGSLPPGLQNAVRSRIEGERVGLPGLALTPYLVGLLVMLGMLGTFLGMVVTFQGAVFAVDGSTDLQAIRSALAAPIKGLALAFGTSVAGVATSAMLGLMSALSRRERLAVTRGLDTCIATVLRPFSLVHQRQEGFRALQAQAHALPEVASQLQALMAQIERRSQQLDEQLLERQAQFHREAGAAYTGLAASVERSLTEALGASARIAGERMQPVVESAMAAIAQESTRLHECVGEAVQRQLDGLGERFAATAAQVADTWQAALQQHARTSERQVSGLDQALAGFTQRFEERSQALLLSVQQGAAAAQAAQALAEQQRQDAWTQSLASLATTLTAEWQQAGAQSLARQQAVCASLEQAAGDIAERTREHAGRTLGEVSRLLAQSDELVRARTEAEARWTQAHAERMDELAALWRSELSALREQEAQRGNGAAERLGQLQATLAEHMATLRQEESARGNAAVNRLGELQAALAGQLATLGEALEAPMTRLLESAAEAPRAATEVIAQLREQMGALAERDNRAMQERTALVSELDALLRTVQQATGEQRAAIESLVASASGVLEQAGRQFSEALGAQSGQVQDVAAHVSGSAVELASLGEAFGHGVQLFSATSEQLVSSLQRIEGAIQQSMARSDEQLGYYVAQAREVIDLSISSQQGIVEDLRRLHSQQAVGAV
ncbi:MAG: DUF802 domain-containing protein [Hydrogenophaga sp.]|nr:DUF802 domain-containing protein [Hydrogenophaga sp.]